MLPIVKQIATEYKNDLQAIYGNDLESLILFGSYARGDYHDESDIDFAVVLKQPDIQAAAVIRRTARISTLLGLKYGLMISTFPASDNKVKTSMQGIYQEIRK